MLRELRRATVTPVGGRYDLRLVVRGRNTRVIRGGEQPLVASFVQDGAAVIVTLLGLEVSKDEIERAFEVAIDIAGLRDDPTGFDALCDRHPVLRRLQRRFGGARLGRTATVFEAFADAVVRQLVTFEEASAALGRLRFRYGARVAGSDLVAFPTARVVAAIAPHELRAMGIGIRRATTLREGAARGPNLEALRLVAPEEAMRKLQSLRGVGRWTANRVAIDAFGHADAVLVGDARVPFETTMALTGRAGGDEELLACLEPYRPHRARVVELLGHARRYDHEIPGVPRREERQVDPHRRYPWRA